MEEGSADWRNHIGQMWPGQEPLGPSRERTREESPNLLPTASHCSLSLGKYKQKLDGQGSQSCSHQGPSSLAALDRGVGLDRGEVAGKGSGNKYLSFFFFFYVSKNSAFVQATRTKIP